MLAGVTDHLKFMDKLRPIYRSSFVETALLLALAFQIGSGLFMVFRSWRERCGWVPWVQALSGLGLAAFIANHVVAVLAGRWIFGLDTNYYYAAAGFQVDGWRWFFIPYYFLGVALLGVHISCAIWWRAHGPAKRWIPWFIAIIFIALAAALVTKMAEVQPIPEQYLATYQAFN